MTFLHTFLLGGGILPVMMPYFDGAEIPTVPWDIITGCVRDWSKECPTLMKIGVSSYYRFVRREDGLWKELPTGTDWTLSDYMWSSGYEAQDCLGLKDY